MIVISGTVEIAEADRERAIAASVAMARASRQEEGCLSYAFYADLENPRLFRAFEEWADEAAVKYHFATPHMKDFRATLATIKILSIEIKRYEVSNVGGL